MPLLLIALLLFGITYLVVRDANARGMNSAGWGFFVVSTMFAGVPIYLLARRKQPKVRS